MRFLEPDWCDLPWTPWQSFSDPPKLWMTPSVPGLYRIRAIGIEELFYIGETGRELRGRLLDLRRGTLNDQMPFNDPHTAAPSLWAWRQAENFQFECSAAPIKLADASEEARKRREGLEFYLLWQYRLEFGSSTRCNHGRFHPRYIKSANGNSQKRGYLLSRDQPDNIAGGKSLPPLQLCATLDDNHWMGLVWSSPQKLERLSLRHIPPSPGVYKIFDPDKKELLYVGETKDLNNRMKDHIVKNWRCAEPLVSFVELSGDTPAYQRHELENDLLGGFYAQAKNMPKCQLINLKRGETSATAQMDEMFDDS